MKNNNSEKHFKDFLSENIKGIFSIRPVVAFLGLSILAIVKTNWNDYLIAIFSPWFWLIFIAALIADALLGAVYWHFYIRSNRYKRHQERVNKSEKDE